MNKTSPVSIILGNPLWGDWIRDKDFPTRLYLGKLVSLKYSVGDVVFILEREG